MFIKVSAPGVRLANKGDLYLNVCLLGQQRRTRLVQPLFPLKFGDHLMFEKVEFFLHNPKRPTAFYFLFVWFCNYCNQKQRILTNKRKGKQPK